IQEKSFRRVGSTNDISVDMRLIAATNKDVEKEVEGKRFREDLFYRLNVIRIHIPPLRERKEDIAQLAAYFLKKYNAEQGKEIKKISGEALNCLMDYDYSGNVRELENAIERAVALEAKDSVSVESLPPAIRDRCVKEGSPATPGDKGTVTGPGASTVTIPPEGIDLEEAVSEFEKNIIKEALKKAGGVKGKAAKLLGISFRSIRYKLGKYDE
ncbi:MAG TPA: sigma 54-interacting transcriptional regulator, partial [Thermodesulfobacteriota bacterium]|nr:sigma 54-interacting transcriptional regulator [Thermodesulfobacteriota bacterium]